MVSVTSHAKRRLKERCGVSKNSAMNMAGRVKINERCNTALLQTEFLALFLRNGIDFVKPASFSTNTIVATIYIKEHLPVCETLKQEIFNTYGTMVNYAIC